MFSPDKNWLIIGNEFVSQLWRVSDGAVVREWPALFCFVAFSPDSSLIASANQDYEDYVLQLWRVSDGSLVRELHDKSGLVEAWFSPDGGLLAARGMESNVQLYRVSDGMLLREWTHTSGGRVAFSPDGSLLLFASDKNTTRVWRVSDGSLVRELNDPSGGSMTFSPDGSLVVSTGSLYRDWVGDDNVRVWRVNDWGLAHELRGATGIVVFSPDGTLIASRAAKELGLLQVWRASDGKLLQEFRGQRNYIDSLAFSQDARLLMSGSTDGTLALWGIPTN